MPKRILIIEDEKALASLLSDYLSADGLEVESRADGASGLEAALSGSFDLVLLDLMLPVMDGFEVCRRLRAERDVPVLILSARREDGDKIRGLGIGADDYVIKPFSPAELVARVKSHLSRYERLTGRARADRWISDGSLSVNVEARRVKRNDAEVMLTAKEFDLLLLFIRNPDRGVLVPDDLPHEFILEIARPYLGLNISTPSDWTPLKHQTSHFPCWNRPDLDLADPWQFKNFLINERGD